MPADPYASAQWRKLRPLIGERDGWQCQMCGKQLDPGSEYDIDHIIPWAEGGSWYDPANLRLACQPCNRARSGARLRVAAKINRTTSSTPSRNWRG